MLKVWEYIVNSAMLGTDKPAISKPDLSEELIDVFNQIENTESLDRESKFLCQAAVVSNYRKSGFQPLKKNDLLIPIAEPEIKEYCPTEALIVLNAILNSGNYRLLKLWMQKCVENELLVSPDLLPELLEMAVTHRALQKLIIGCGGNRGKWLSEYNPEWNFYSEAPHDEEIWLTGKPDERASLLKRIRETNPDIARNMVIQTWKEENAAQKLVFLEILKSNISTADLPWLESLSAEKGKKVKDEILSLLKFIPGSSIIKKYELYLAQVFVLSKERAFAGLFDKTIMHLNIPDTIDESIYKSGIEAFSPRGSKLNDKEYVLYQLIETVPPVFWEEHLKASSEQAINYFEKYAAIYIPALCVAVSVFKQKKWLPYFLNQRVCYPGLADMLNIQQQEEYLLRFTKQNHWGIVQYFSKRKKEVSVEFAIALFKIISDNPYQYNKGFYSNHIHLIPVELLLHWDNIVQKVEDDNQWHSYKDYILNLLNLKQQVLQAFNAKKS